MSWSYRDPLTFPASFPSIMREAVAHLEQPVLFASGARDQIEAKAEHFRWYRWCLRKSYESAMSRLEGLYQFRASLEQSGGRWLLYITARPTNLQCLISHNPHLSPIIAAECQ